MHDFKFRKPFFHVNIRGYFSLEMYGKPPIYQQRDTCTEISTYVLNTLKIFNFQLKPLLFRDFIKKSRWM